MVPRALKPELAEDADPESPASPTSPLFSPWQSCSVEQFTNRDSKPRHLQESEVQAILDDWNRSKESRSSYHSMTLPVELSASLPPNRLIHDVHNAHMCQLSKDRQCLK